jgi:hypothetical protein
VLELHPLAKDSGGPAGSWLDQARSPCQDTADPPVAVKKKAASEGGEVTLSTMVAVSGKARGEASAWSYSGTPIVTS